MMTRGWHLKNDICNIDEALSRIDGDTELLRELAGLFLENYPAQLTGIKSAIIRQDSKALESIAHNFKGSVGVFCAKRVFETALRLEIMGREKDMAGVQEAYTTLKHEIERLKPKLEAIMIEQ